MGNVKWIHQHLLLTKAGAVLLAQIILESLKRTGKFVWNSTTNFYTCNSRTICCLKARESQAFYEQPDWPVIQISKRSSGPRKKKIAKLISVEGTRTIAEEINEWKSRYKGLKLQYESTKLYMRTMEISDDEGRNYC